MKQYHQMNGQERAEHEHTMAMAMHALLREATRKRMQEAADAEQEKTGTTIELLDQIVGMFAGSKEAKSAHRRLRDGL